MPDSADAFRTTYCAPRRAPRPPARRWTLVALVALLLLCAWLAHAAPPPAARGALVAAMADGLR